VLCAVREAIVTVPSGGGITGVDGPLLAIMPAPLAMQMPLMTQTARNILNFFQFTVYPICTKKHGPAAPCEGISWAGLSAILQIKERSSLVEDFNCAAVERKIAERDGIHADNRRKANAQ
jgi:hypothetical protein